MVFTHVSLYLNIGRPGWQILEHHRSSRTIRGVLLRACMSYVAVARSDTLPLKNRYINGRSRKSRDLCPIKQYEIGETSDTTP